MTKVLYSLAALAALAVTAGPAAAQYPAPGPYGPVMPASYGQPGCTHCDGGAGYGGYGFGGYGHSGYGLGIGSKLKSGLFGFGMFGGLFTNHGHAFGGGAGGGGWFARAQERAANAPVLPVVDPRTGNAGQLAFPQNPFVRSPRDYYILDGR